MDTKKELNRISDKEIEQFLISCFVIDDYMSLYKTCYSETTRRMVLHNAKRAMSREDYDLFLSMCLSHIESLLAKLPKPDNRQDENFTY
jgi:hypothetical protein